MRIQSDSTETTSSAVPTIRIPSKPIARVRHDAAWVTAQSTHVKVVNTAVANLVEGLERDEARRIFKHEWDEDLHLGAGLSGDTALVQYLLVMDALNFCFWPQPGLEYEHLARGLKKTVQKDPTALEASRLESMDGPAVQRLLGRSQPLPLQEERAALLREIGCGLQRSWGGLAFNMVTAAQGSAETLVAYVLDSFPGFRDYSLYRGREVWLLKRAQIFVGDVWGTFGGQGCGSFHDIGCLTAFADYRIPVLLRQKGILQYSGDLAHAVDKHVPITAGSEEEIELRACTVVAVEEIRKALQQGLGNCLPAEAKDSRDQETPKSATETASGGLNRQSAGEERIEVNSVLIDWWLWETGEAQRNGPNAHHRTITTFY